MLGAQLDAIGPTSWRVDGQPVLADGVLEAWIGFETKHSRGRGILRLRDGRAWTLLTAIEELKGFEERKGTVAPTRRCAWRLPTRQELAGGRSRAEEEALGNEKQPYCVIIGGGQGGIALGARLKQLDVPTIILEKNARAGNSWRNRYRSLVLHDPVWYDHLPYIPFPENWPVFTPKDKLGDWLEMYAKVMELNYWGSSECVRAGYDEKQGEWIVDVLREGTRGDSETASSSSSPPAPTARRTSSLCRASRSLPASIATRVGYKTGKPYAGKSCIVVGANSSAHDIAADLWEYGAQVTMLQRSPTTVVRSETLMELGVRAALFGERAQGGDHDGQGRSSLRINAVSYHAPQPDPDL